MFSALAFTRVQWIQMKASQITLSTYIQNTIMNVDPYLFRRGICSQIWVGKRGVLLLVYAPYNCVERRVLTPGQGDGGHYHASPGYPESWLCPPDNHRYIPWREGGKEGGGGEGNRDEIRSQWYSLPHACMCRRGKAMPSCLCICVSVGQRILKNISSTVAKAF